MNATRSQCGKCGQIFAGVAAFDEHRTGSFTQNTRRCLSVREMQARGMIRNDKGWWSLPLAPVPAPWSLTG